MREGMLKNKEYSFLLQHTALLPSNRYGWIFVVEMAEKTVEEIVGLSFWYGRFIA